MKKWSCKGLKIFVYFSDKETFEQRKNGRKKNQGYALPLVTMTVDIMEPEPSTVFQGILDQSCVSPNAGGGRSSGPGGLSLGGRGFGGGGSSHGGSQQLTQSGQRPRFDEDADLTLIKVVVLGAPGVGKTSIVKVLNCATFDFFS